MTTQEAIEWTLVVLEGRRRDWNWTDRKGMDPDLKEQALYFDKQDADAITELEKLLEPAA